MVWKPFDLLSRVPARLSHQPSSSYVHRATTRDALSVNERPEHTVGAAYGGGGASPTAFGARQRVTC